MCRNHATQCLRPGLALPLQPSGRRQSASHILSWKPAARLYRPLAQPGRPWSSCLHCASQGGSNIPPHSIVAVGTIKLLNHADYGPFGGFNNLINQVWIFIYQRCILTKIVNLISLGYARFIGNVQRILRPGVRPAAVRLAAHLRRRGMARGVDRSHWIGQDCWRHPGLGVSQAP